MKFNLHLLESSLIDLGFVLTLDLEKIGIPYSNQEPGVPSKSSIVSPSVGSKGSRM